MNYSHLVQLHIGVEGLGYLLIAYQPQVEFVWNQVESNISTLAIIQHIFLSTPLKPLDYGQFSSIHMSFDSCF